MTKKSSKLALPSLEMKPIAWVDSCFKNKFGIPRQPGLVSKSRGFICFLENEYISQSLSGLETFSHLWVLFHFHDHRSKNWKPTIRPPRLGGQKRVGVLASRSPHRPNPIGLSVVKLIGIDYSHPKAPRIEIEGHDLLDGTPVFDIKPYLPYADVVEGASGGWAAEGVSAWNVEFAPLAKIKLAEFEVKHPTLKEFIIEMLSIDPRPASQRRKMPLGHPSSVGKNFGIAILNYDVKWTITQGEILVTDILVMPSGSI